MRHPFEYRGQPRVIPTFFVANEALQKIDSAPGENREKIDRVIEMLQSARHSDNCAVDAE